MLVCLVSRDRLVDNGNGGVKKIKRAHGRNLNTDLANLGALNA